LVKPFEEIVKELEKKYRVRVDPAVTRKIVRVVGRELGKLVEKKKYRNLSGVRFHFKDYYKKLWCWRQTLASVDAFLGRSLKRRGIEFSPRVREEVNRVYSSLTADTLYAAAAYVVLKKAGKRNPDRPTITLDDAKKTCEEFLLIDKPEWLC